jgi:hypothetical protein
MNVSDSWHLYSDILMAFARRGTRKIAGSTGLMAAMIKFRPAVLKATT